MNQFTNHQTIGDDCRESGEGETMREQFEAWITKGMSEMHKGIMLRRLECSDGYFHTVTRASWEAWQASRAAIEIEIYDFDTFSPYDCGDDAVWTSELTKTLAKRGIIVKE